MNKKRKVLGREELDHITAKTRDVNASEIEEGAWICVREFDSDGFDKVQLVIEDYKKKKLRDIQMLHQVAGLLVSDDAGNLLYTDEDVEKGAFSKWPFLLLERVVNEGLAFNRMDQESRKEVTEALSRPTPEPGSASRGNGAGALKKRKPAPAGATS